MLELQNISLRVDGGKEILDDISLKVGNARFTVITGPNGGGKSTLAKVIAGIMQPQSGKILWNGKDITNMTITERAKLGISFAFQQPVRFKGICVRDLIQLAGGGKLTEKEIRDYLCNVGLCARDYISREVNASLSGGEIKRIEIAMVMARKTPLTIFDEPEAGIDLWSFQNLIEVFQKLRTETQGSVLLISHQERILEIADELIVLSDGKIINQGPREKILPTLVGGVGGCDFCPRPIIPKQKEEAI